MKQRKKTESITAAGENRRGTGARQRRRPLNHTQHSTNISIQIRPATHGSPEKTKPDHGRLTDHNNERATTNVSKTLDKRSGLPFLFSFTNSYQADINSLLYKTLSYCKH